MRLTTADQKVLTNLQLTNLDGTPIDLNKAGAGIFPKRGVLYFQPPQVKGVRPEMVCLRCGEGDVIQAVQRKFEHLALLSNAGYAPGKTCPLPVLVEEQLKSNNYTRATLRAKSHTMRRFAVSMGEQGLQLEAILPHHVQAWYDGLAVKRSTAKKMLNDVKAFFTWAVKTKKIAFSPAKQIVMRKRTEAERQEKELIKPNRFCTRAQRDQLITNCPREDIRLVLMLGFHLGLRFNEIVEARPEWFHMEGGRKNSYVLLVDTATKKFNLQKRGRLIPMRTVLYDYLKKHGIASPFLLHPEVKQGISQYRYDFRIPFRNYVTSQGMPWVHPHIMRHSFASLCFSSGTTAVGEVASWMGNTEAEARKTYIHFLRNSSAINSGEDCNVSRAVAAMEEAT